MVCFSFQRAEKTSPDHIRVLFFLLALGQRPSGEASRRMLFLVGGSVLVHDRPLALDQRGEFHARTTNSDVFVIKKWTIASL